MDHHHRKVIKENFVGLAENIDLVELVPRLIETKVFPQDMAKKYIGSNSNGNSSDINETTKRLILDIPTRGPSAFDNFVESLKLAKQHAAVKLLEPNYAIPIVDDVRRDDDSLEETFAEPIDGVVVRKSGPSDRAGRETRITYQITSKPRGYVLLVVNAEYDDRTLNREAADTDLKLWDELFTKLGYEVVVRKNADYKQMDEALNAFSSQKFHEEVDSCIVAISSHGTRDGILCTDGMCYPQKTVLAKFNNLNCAALRLKPKLFFIQACRGSFSDDGVPLDKADSKSKPAPGKSHHLPTFTDILVAHSTLEDYKAHRNTKHGSWFVQIVTKVFMEKAYNSDVEKMLKEVQQIMRTRRTVDGEKQMCDVQNLGFDKYFYFDP